VGGQNSLLTALFKPLAPPAGHIYLLGGEKRQKKKRN